MFGKGCQRGSEDATRAQICPSSILSVPFSLVCLVLVWSLLHPSQHLSSCQACGREDPGRQRHWDHLFPTGYYVVEMPNVVSALASFKE